MPKPIRTRPVLHLTINGALPQELKESILQVVVEESLHLPGVFTIALENPFKPGYPAEDFPIMKFLNSHLQIGREVVIGFSNAATDLDQFTTSYDYPRMLVGEITAVEVPFSKRAQTPIIIRGYSYSHRLHRGRWNRSFLDRTDSDIALILAGEAGIPIGQVDPSGIVHEYVFQENQTNMEFLKERAARIGFEVFVLEGLFYFRKPKENPIEGNIDWLNYSLDNIRVRANSIEQVKDVQVRGWDYPNKIPFIAKTVAQSGSVITNVKGQGDGVSISSKFNKPGEQTFYVVDQPVYQQIEADFIAQSCCDEIRGQYIHADVEAEGDPRIRPGRSFILEGNTTKIPEHFAGKYYITETRHVYEPDRERSYNTEFVIRGLRNSDLLTTLSPPNRLQPGQTFLIGIVTENRDPENMSRIKVIYPTLTEDHNSHWARMVSIGAGIDRGTDWLPEIGDEVIVGFEHGDIHRPLVIGSVWNGVDKPPEHIDDSVPNELVRLRTLRSRRGHQIQFIDETKVKRHKPDISEQGIRIATLLNGVDGEHKIYLNDESRYIDIDTNGGHHIHMQDAHKGEKHIDIKTSGNHNIRMDDVGKYIEIRTAQGHFIRMDDAQSFVEVRSNHENSIKMHPLGIDINSMGMINMTAPGIISINGLMIRLN